MKTAGSTALQETRLTLFAGVRVGAENFHHGAVAGEFLERLGNVFRFRVAGEIDVKDVFPILALGGAGFDFRKVDLKVVEGLQGAYERAWPVVDREEDGGAVVAGGRAGLFTDDKEPCGVRRAILDRGFQEIEAMDLGGDKRTN